ncbi:MAG: hypothetical protein QMD44_05970 [Thermodesulfovibrionales bacterium]|nr:hypothetical protein [Thermodesulfovibrionales bacterium]
MEFASSRLEIGLHALNVIGKASAGRGKTGGLSDYARRLGRTSQYLTQITAAAGVYEYVAKSVTQVTDLFSRTKHLYAISQSPQSLWTLLCEMLIKNDWSVKDTEEAVTKIKDLDIPEEYQGLR